MQETLSTPATPAPSKNHPAVEVTVVMPCLNEARTVGRCVTKALAAFERLGVSGEVVVADNGSDDGSPALARACGARVIHAERRGYGSALQAGIAAAHGRYVIMGDADDSYDFSCLEPFLEQLRAGHDLVMGNRFRGGIMPGAMPWLHRYIGNPVLTGILNLFFHSPIRDAHCGLRAFRRDACLRLGLTSPGMEFASEMVVKACLNRLKISEVPTVLHPDGRCRPPHLRSFRDGWRHLRFLLLMCPLWLYLVPSGLLFALGLGAMIWLTVAPAGAAGLPPFASAAAVLSVVVGYQAAWLGRFASLYGRASGLFPPDPEPHRAGRHVLERSLLAASTLLLIGLGMIALTAWRSGAGEPQGPSPHLGAWHWGVTLMTLGVQTTFNSFFVALLGMAPGVPAGRATDPGSRRADELFS